MKNSPYSFLLCLLFSALFSFPAFAAEVTVESKRQSSAVGVGLQGIADWSTQFPFLDVMKSAREWYDWEKRTTEGIGLNKNDWVISIEKGLRPETVFLTNIEGQPIVYSHYIVRWRGKGRLGYGGCARKVGRAYGGDRIATGEGECFLALESIDASDPIRDITIVPEKHIAAFDQGEKFNPDFIEKIQGFRSLRFMDWLVTNGSLQERWSERSLPTDRSYAKKGVPVEVIMELSNKVVADPWVNMPHKVGLDYFREFAKLTKQLLDPELKIYIEHSNETWNWLFPQTQYALKAAREQFNAEGDAYVQWHGMRTAQMCEIWKKEVFTDNPERVVCVLGTQASWPGLEQAALDCPLWVKQGNRPCADYGIDSIGIAGYFSGCLSGGENKVHQRKIIGWGRLEDRGLSKAYEQVIDGRHFECDDTLPQVKKHYEYFVKEARRRGMTVVAYEGGQHITSNFGETQDDERFSNLHIHINRSPYMKTLYQKNFKNWQDAGGTLFMHFVDTSAYSKHGSWGALEYITQETSPKWEALMEFNETPCWWKGCR